MSIFHTGKQSWIKNKHIQQITCNISLTSESVIPKIKLNLRIARSPILNTQYKRHRAFNNYPNITHALNINDNF